MLMYSERYLLCLLVALHLEELILHLHETYKENCTKTATKSKVAKNHIITIDILPLFSDVSDIVKTKLEGNFQFQIESLDGVVGFPFKYRRLFLALRQHVSS